MTSFYRLRERSGSYCINNPPKKVEDKGKRGCSKVVGLSISPVSCLHDVRIGLTPYVMCTALTLQTLADEFNNIGSRDLAVRGMYLAESDESQMVMIAKLNFVFWSNSCENVPCSVQLCSFQ